MPICVLLSHRYNLTIRAEDTETEVVLLNTDVHGLLQPNDPSRGY